MTSISTVVAILFKEHYPSHRTSGKEVEGGLLSSYTREKLEIQEVSELEVVTLVVRYNTLFIKQCIFFHIEREERVERRIQNIGNK